MILGCYAYRTISGITVVHVMIDGARERGRGARRLKGSKYAVAL